MAASSFSHVDVLVLGGGPAGRALAGECAARGLRTTLVEPAPDRPWRATYGAWDDELPATLPGHVVGARAVAHAFGTGPHRLGRRYVVLDTAALRAHLDRRSADVRVVAARSLGTSGSTVATTAGDLTAAVVVDATGAPGRPSPAEQTAYGVVVPEQLAAPVVAPGEALFMDWRPAHGHDGWPTFLYAVPYGDGTVLLEETSLARRPGLGLSELRARLHARLHRWGIEPGDAAREERVRFAVDSPRAPAHPVAFGAATPLVHPASGFSVASALTLAPRVAEALRSGLETSSGHSMSGAARVSGDGAPGTVDATGGSGSAVRPGTSRGLPGFRGRGRSGRSPRADGPDRAVAAAQAVLWPPAAVAVHRLRRHGLRTVLGLPPDLVPEFFEAFFRLPDHRSRAFLSGRDDLQGTLGAMAGLFRQADPAIRARLVRSAVWPVASGATPTGDVPRAGVPGERYR